MNNLVNKSGDLVNDLVNDTISRQAAIAETWKDTGYSDPLNVMTAIRDRLEALPSAQPDLSPCDVCRYYPPSSMDGKPCTMCPAERKNDE